MTIKKVFKSYIPSVNYVTQKGRTCIFVEGRYETDIPEEIAELNSVCESKSNPHIFIDPNEDEIDTTVQDRLRSASQKAYLAELAAINAEKNQVAENKKQGIPQINPQTISPAALLGVTTSATLGGNVQASNSSPVAVK